MAKVYEVSTGSYSDRGTVGIFSTREKAQEVVEKLKAAGNGDVNDIDEWELDAVVGWEHGPIYRAIFYKAKDTVLTSGELDDLRHPTRCEVSEIQHCIRVASPISEEHAIKVATEERQRWLREKATSHAG